MKQSINLKIGLQVSLFMSKVKMNCLPTFQKPFVSDFLMRYKLDSYHASNIVTRISKTGLLVWLNYSFVHWFYKKQNIMEIIIFVS